MSPPPAPSIHFAPLTRPTQYINKPRWTTANVAPLVFVAWIALSIWGSFCFFRLLPRVKVFEPLASLEETSEVVVIPWLAGMAVLCYLKVMFTEPGKPTDDWERSARTDWAIDFYGGALVRGPLAYLVKPEVAQHERKHSGARRFCKWCKRYKPDRTHHCRVCGGCVLRMDHHCPWVAACIGFKNHKSFLLLVLYAGLACGAVAIALGASARGMVREVEMTHSGRAVLVCGLTLASVMTLALTVFFIFHVAMVLRDTTTVEYCEKRVGGRSRFDQGPWRNLLAILGPQPVLWLLPVDVDLGSGTLFPIAAGCETPQGRSSRSLREGCEVLKAQTPFAEDTDCVAKGEGAEGAPPPAADEEPVLTFGGPVLSV